MIDKLFHEMTDAEKEEVWKHYRDKSEKNLRELEKCPIPSWFRSPQIIVTTTPTKDDKMLAAVIILLALCAFCSWMFYNVGKTVGHNEGKTEAEKRTINILHGRIDE